MRKLSNAVIAFVIALVALPVSALAQKLESGRDLWAWEGRCGYYFEVYVDGQGYVSGDGEGIYRNIKQCRNRVVENSVQACQVFQAEQPKSKLLVYSGYGYTTNHGSSSGGYIVSGPECEVTSSW